MAGTGQEAGCAQSEGSQWPWKAREVRMSGEFLVTKTALVLTRGME